MSISHSGQNSVQATWKLYLWQHTSISVAENIPATGKYSWLLSRWPSYFRKLRAQLLINTALTCQAPQPLARSHIDRRSRRWLYRAGLESTEYNWTYHNSLGRPVWTVNKIGYTGLEPVNSVSQKSMTRRSSLTGGQSRSSGSSILMLKSLSRRLFVSCLETWWANPFGMRNWKYLTVLIQDCWSRAVHWALDWDANRLGHCPIKATNLTLTAY